MLQNLDQIVIADRIANIMMNGLKKRQPLWYYQALQKAKTPEQRRTLRSKTFQGIAEAMAKQWSEAI